MAPPSTQWLCKDLSHGLQSAYSVIGYRCFVRIWIIWKVSGHRVDPGDQAALRFVCRFPFLALPLCWVMLRIIGRRSAIKESAFCTNFYNVDAVEGLSYQSMPHYLQASRQWALFLVK